MTAVGPGGGAQPQRLSQEEARVLRECIQESFYGRVVPLSAALMGGTLYMIRSGRWQAAGRLGPLPKLAVAGLVGYVVGKMSYMEVCKQRLIAMPNSRLGQMLRRQRDGGAVELPRDGGANQPPAAAAEADLAPPPRTEGGLDDYYRPTVDGPSSPVLSIDDLAQAQTPTTYEQLRRDNRAALETRLRRGVPAEPAGDGASPPAQHRQPLTPPAAAVENKYGDVWDK